MTPGRLVPRLVLLLAVSSVGLALAAGQQPASATASEQEELETVLSEAGSSPAEYLRALEKHLGKYPRSPRRPELERAAARAAVEAGDGRRVVLYGEMVLARQPDDLQFLEQVTRALLSDGSSDGWGRALKYARRYEELVRRMQAGPASSAAAADLQAQAARALGRAFAWEARATGNLGRPEEALALARRAIETDPTAEAAREIARWLEKLGRPGEAALALADAFTVQDARSTDADRARDRGRMGELYVQAHGSEAGLGDLVLEAYDRNLALVHAREMRLRAANPNARLKDPMEFTLGAFEGQPLAMASLRGKVVVMDFWATWCGPCRVQHPLLEKVRQRFARDAAVVFLSINIDDDRDAVKPFLADVRWTGPVYFDDGLANALRVSSIPTTLILDRNGRIFSRMNGFVPAKFVEALAGRIREALE